MLNTINDTTTAQSRPLTHSTYIAAYPTERPGVRQPARPWVQVRKRYAGERVVLCGQVNRLTNGDGGKELFEVGTGLGPVWAEGQNVRLCSGDGRCACEPASPQPDPGERQGSPSTTMQTNREPS